MEKILIFGGSRFHGYQLAQSLSKTGNEVNVLNRGNFRSEYPLGINLIKADRNDPASLKTALLKKEFSAVIDNSCYTPNQMRISLEVLSGKFQHYVFTSTIAAYLTYASEQKLKEEENYKSDFFPPNIKEYALNKLAAEQVLRTSFKNNTILRVPNVFGEGDFLGKLFFFDQRISQGRKILLEKEVDKFSLVYVKDLVKIMQETVLNEKCINKTINIADTAPHSYVDFFSSVYKNFSLGSLLLIPAKDLWEKGYFPLFPWMPELDCSLQNKIFVPSFTPIKDWAPKTLEWEIEYFKTHIHKGGLIGELEDKLTCVKCLKT